jgi:hypothetical protein
VWERPGRGYAIEQVIEALKPDETYFWSTHSGAELDLFLIKDGKRIGVECKRMDAPSLTKSMQTALRDLELDELIVVYPGRQPYPLSKSVKVLPLANIFQAEA